MSSFGIYKESTNVNHTGVLIFYENHVITLDFDPHLCNGENGICVRKYENSEIGFSKNSISDKIYDFVLSLENSDGKREMCVKVIKHLEIEINHNDLLFDIGNYHMFDNNCRVHVCKTIMLFQDKCLKKYSRLNNIKTCWDVILDSATKNYEKVLRNEKLLICIYNIFKSYQKQCDNFELEKISMFVDNVILEYCLKNYGKILFPLFFPTNVYNHINGITKEINENIYVERETVINIVYTILYCCDKSINFVNDWWKFLKNEENIHF